MKEILMEKEISYYEWSKFYSTLLYCLYLFGENDFIGINNMFNVFIVLFRENRSIYFLINSSLKTY